MLDKLGKHLEDVKKFIAAQKEGHARSKVVSLVLIPIFGESTRLAQEHTHEMI